MLPVPKSPRSVVVRLSENGARSTAMVDWLPLSHFQQPPALDQPIAAGARLLPITRINWARTFARHELLPEDYTCVQHAESSVTGTHCFEFERAPAASEEAMRDNFILRWDPLILGAVQGDVLVMQCEELHIPVLGVDVTTFIPRARLALAEHLYSDAMHMLGVIRGWCDSAADRDGMDRLINQWTVGMFVHVFCAAGNPALQY